MLRSLFTAALIASSCLLAHAQATPAASQQEVIDGIAAIVNGEVITYSQVRELVAPRERLLRAQYTGQELANKIREARQAALKDLIDRELIVQAFHKEKFEIPSFVVETHINDIIRESFGGDRQAFLKTLQAQNYSLNDFRRIEKERIIVQAMRAKNVKPVTAVPPGKVDEYYRTHRAEFASKEEVKLRMIMIPSRDSATSKAAAKDTAEEIRQKLVDGADFDRMAQIYSEDTTRDSGGDWGWVERKTLAEPLERVAFSLKPGQVSNVIELGGNYYILKVEDRRGGEVKPLSELRAEIEKRLIQDEAQRLQERWLTTLRQKAYIRTF